MPYAPRTHGAERPRERAPDRRLNAGKRGYDAKWQRFRRWYLRRHPLCQSCKEDGRVRAAVLVDHVIPLSEGGEHLTEENSQALCRACHARKTNKENANASKG